MHSPDPGRPGDPERRQRPPEPGRQDSGGTTFGRGDDTVGNPHRAQITQFELLKLILLLKLDKQLPVERWSGGTTCLRLLV